MIHMNTDPVETISPERTTRASLFPVRRKQLEITSDSPQIALVTFPGAMPELSVDPGDPGDEAVGLDSVKNRPCWWIDLMDLSVAILRHPERPFGPREPRAIAAGRRDRGEHTVGFQE